MKSWKRRSRAQRKAQYQLWWSSDSDHKSRWALNRWPSRDVNSWEGWGHRSWRKEYSRRWKRDIKKVNDGLKLFKEFPYYEDCRYHVCKVTELDPNPDWGRLDVDGESLLNGTPSSCSYFHCGIVHLTKEEGEERAAFANEMGMMPYQIRYVYDPSENLRESIRYAMGMERNWKFNENSKTETITLAGKKWLEQTHGICYDDLEAMTDEEMKASLEEN